MSVCLAVLAPLANPLDANVVADGMTTPASPVQDGVLQEVVAPTIVFVVRHAEKGTNDARDPGLSEAGTARATELAHLLAHANVSHLVASEFHRTQDTLAPLATLTGLAVETVSARESAALAQRLRELPPGSVAVVCGHSNTVPQLVDLLRRSGAGAGATSEMGNLAEDEYDRLFEVVLPPVSMAEGVRALAQCVVELRYGRAE